MKFLKMKFLALTAAAAFAVSGPANAVPIDTALSVVIDGSSSISGSEFTTQQNAYASVLGNASVLPANGSVVINVIQFSTEGSGITELSALRINNEADRTTLVNAINAMSQINGLTDIQEGIALGVTDMDSFLGGLAAGEFGTDFRKIVDVSTDGGHNEGGDPAAEAQNAVNTLGYEAVNCLGIGTGFDCSFNDGVGADFVATTFNDLEPVLEDKIRQELRTDVPVPAPLALLVIGLLAMGLARRGRA